MNSRVIASILLVALALIMVVDAHKKFYSAPQFEGPDRCVCDCNQGPPPVLPNKPYYGSAGYAPRPAAGGYGNAGAYAVSGSYGSQGGQVSGGY